MHGIHIHSFLGTNLAAYTTYFGKINQNDENALIPLISLDKSFFLMFRKPFNLFQTLPALTKCIHKAFSVGSETVSAKSSNGSDAKPLSAAQTPVTPQLPIAAQFQMATGDVVNTRPPLSDQVSA
jgi:hypothetical protein